jgi:hypothetical protein
MLSPWRAIHTPGGVSFLSGGHPMGCKGKKKGKGVKK